mgnify:CR=1 FL=1
MTPNSDLVVQTKQLSKVFLLPNGTVVMFDVDGQQVPDLQEPYILDVVARIEKAGYDPLTPKYRLPSGVATLFRTESGFNWSISDDAESGHP